MHYYFGSQCLKLLSCYVLEYGSLFYSFKTDHQQWTENSNQDPKEIRQMKRLLLCLNMFNMWMADRAWLSKFLPPQGRVTTKRTGLAHSEGYLAPPYLRLPLLKMVNSTQMILQNGCCLEVHYYKMDQEG